MIAMLQCINLEKNTGMGRFFSRKMEMVWICEYIQTRSNECKELFCRQLADK
mgnify:FL=1